MPAPTQTGPLGSTLIADFNRRDLPNCSSDGLVCNVTNLADGIHSQITLIQGVKNGWPGFTVRIDFNNWDEATKAPNHLYGIGATVTVAWNVPAPAVRNVKVVIDEFKVMNPGDLELPLGLFTDGEWDVSALIGDTFKHILFNGHSVGHDLGAPYSEDVNVGTVTPKTGGTDCLARTVQSGPASDAACTNEFPVSLLPGQPLRVFLRLKEIDASEIDVMNDDLGLVEHIFTAAGNYGIGTGKFYVENFQEHSSSGDDPLGANDLLGHTPLHCPCGSVKFHIEDVPATNTPATYNPKPVMKNPEPLGTDGAKLRNTQALGTILVALAKALTTTNTKPDQLVQQLQDSIDAALIAAGLTPGFMQTAVIDPGTPFVAGTVPFGAPVFVPQGNHLHFGLTGDLSCVATGTPDCDNPVAGAVSAVVAHPNDPNILWIGTVNGGVWRTTAANAVASIGLVPWQPLLDIGPQMSINTLALDPTVVLAAGSYSNAVLVAGIGNASSAFMSSPLTGVIRSTDGGATWTRLGVNELAGLTVTGVAPRGNVIVVGTKGSSGGVWRSSDAGNSFVRISGNTRLFGLPAGDVFDLIGEPGNPQRLYVAIVGAGVFTSNNLGATWQPAGGTTFGDGNAVASWGGITPATGPPWTAVLQTAAIRLAASSTSLYAAIMNVALLIGTTPTIQLAALYQSKDQGTTWKPLTAPATNPGGYPAPNFLSIAADPTNADRFYLGGDREPNPPYFGLVFRCSAAGATGSCTSITGANAPNPATIAASGPHSDSRAMTFAGSRLIEVDDGGIYAFCTGQAGICPNANAAGANVLGYWISLNGGHATPHLQIAEQYACGYDSINDIIICANQDNAVTEQTFPGDSQWRSVTAGDGSLAGVDDNDASANPSSVRYSASQNLGTFTRRTCDNTNNCLPAGAAWCQYSAPNCNPPPGTLIALHDSATNADIRTMDPIAFVPPFAVNAVATQRFVVGTLNRVWETQDQGDHVTAVVLPNAATTPGTVKAVAYGGKDGAANAADVLYVGAESGLFVRTATGGIFGALTQSVTYRGGTPLSIVLDPNNWRIAYATDGAQVFRTINAGGQSTCADGTVGCADWLNITGNLFALGPSQTLTLTFVPKGTAAGGALLVGTDVGIFAMLTGRLGWWVPFGTTLPRTFVTSLVYSNKHSKDTLIVGTFGRGTWKLDNASTAIFGYSQLFGAAPADQRFQVGVQLTGTGTSGTYTVTGTQVRPRRAGGHPDPDGHQVRRHLYRLAGQRQHQRRQRRRHRHRGAHHHRAGENRHHTDQRDPAAGWGRRE
ncbi:MAG: hypothetical protein E6J20_00540 [Chloroflexi bacterium]|nr:MAG: hypothetical protein E6J20_00540 [Chloroflexota bacterium]